MPARKARPSVANMTTHDIPEREIAERPAGYEGPNLSPVGLELESHELADELTHRPLRYLVNTTYHGYHTFGNAAFPADVTVISSRINKENMTDLGYEKSTRSKNMYGDEGLLDAVTDWRAPDVVFDSHAQVDLGGRVVELWQFGPGNGPGDTVVYVPDARAAWTGNYLCHAGTAPMLLQGGPEPYLASLRRMSDALPDLRTVVPGHGPVGDGPEAITWLVDYLERFRDDVVELHAAGHSLEETLELCPSPYEDGLDDRLRAALAAYRGPQDAIQAGFLALCRNLHRLNVLATYRVVAGSAHPA